MHNSGSILLITLGLIGVVISTAPFAFYSLTLSVPNAIAVFSGDASGQLSFVHHVPTGDNGIPDGDGGAGSQHAIVVKDNYLFAVNPSSNSLSMFVIDPTNPTSLKLVNTISTKYDWPNTVTVHPLTDIVCVATSGENNGIRCFSYTSSGGLVVLDGTDRALGLKLTNPPAFHTGPAQISFSPDGSGVVVSIKTPSPHTLFYYSFSESGLSEEPIVSSVMGNVPYGFAFDTDGTVFLTDAAPTGTFSGIQLVSANSSAIDFLLPSYFLIQDQEASCWVERSPVNGHFYVVNTVTFDVTEVARSETTLSILGNYPTGNNTFPTDITFVQLGGSTYAYVQATSTIVVLDVSSSGKGELVQTVDQQSIGAYAAGAAVYVAGSSSLF